MRWTVRNKKEQRAKHLRDNALRLHASESHFPARFRRWLLVCSIINETFWP